MAIIPESVLAQCPLIPGLPLLNRGKVRDSYDLPGHPDKMYIEATDRISIFDIVLPTFISGKGQVLTAKSFSWESVLREKCPTDFIATGSAIDQFLPEPLRGDPERQKRGTVVKKLGSPEIEDVVRFILTGSGWKDYRNNDRVVCGHRLPAGLKNGSRLPYPIYTPTTKAKEGHDMPLNYDDVIKKYGYKRAQLAIELASLIAHEAELFNVMFGDTKFEFHQAEDGTLTLIDERGTPDSSRYFLLTAYNTLIKQGKLAPSLDKQYVRNHGITLGIDKLDPKNPADIAKVHAMEFPEDIRRMTALIYRYILWKRTGKRLEVFQHDDMGIDVKPAPRHIEILVGSKSDLKYIEQGPAALSSNDNQFRLSVMSCHRNPEELRQFAESELTKADIVIAGAGKAADLPGIAKSWLCHYGRPDIPVIGVGFKGETERDDFAAKSSIEDLPGLPVELNEDGRAYFGELGFSQACHAAAEDEFLPKNMEKKPVEIGRWTDGWTSK